MRSRTNELGYMSFVFKAKKIYLFEKLILYISFFSFLMKLFSKSVMIPPGGGLNPFLQLIFQIDFLCKKKKKKPGPGSEIPSLL